MHVAATSITLGVMRLHFQKLIVIGTRLLVPIIKFKNINY